MLWIPIATPPAELHIFDNVGGIRHPFTPTSIRNSKVSVESGVWRDEPYVGIILGGTERAWRCDELRAIELFYMMPAKGSGHVAIIVSAENMERHRQSITSSNHFGKDLLEWSRQVLHAFDRAGITIKENNEGFDV